MKKELKDPRDMYFGNLFIIQDGIGTISDIRYIVIRQKEHFWSKVKYVAYPGEIEVFVGESDITYEDENIPFLINSVQLTEKVGYSKIDTKQICDIIIQNNDPKQLKKYI